MKFLTPLYFCSFVARVTSEIYEIVFFVQINFPQELVKIIAVGMEVAAGVMQSVINWEIAAQTSMTIARGKATVPNQ